MNVNKPTTRCPSCCLSKVPVLTCKDDEKIVSSSVVVARDCDRCDTVRSGGVLCYARASQYIDDATQVPFLVFVENENLPTTRGAHLRRQTFIVV